jgi:hypothetical protein
MASMLSSGHNSQGTLVAYIGKVIPSAASSMVGTILAQTANAGRAWLSLIFALWASSSATVGIMNTLNIIYGVKEDRPWWRARLLAMALAAATGILLTAALVVCGVWSCPPFQSSTCCCSIPYLEVGAVAVGSCAFDDGPPLPLSFRSQSEWAAMEASGPWQCGCDRDMDCCFSPFQTVRAALQRLWNPVWIARHISCPDVLVLPKRRRDPDRWGGELHA